MKRRGQGIVHVSDLFAKYAATLKAPQKTVINAFVEVVRQTVGCSIKPEQCAYSVHTRTITLTMSGMVKTEILFKKEEILTTLGASIGERNTPHNIL